jgi:glutaminyl-tRNA synthetase
MENPPKKFFRLAPGREVRLKHAYFITCKEVIKDDNGEIRELRCVYDPETRGGDAPDGRKVKGTLHWVSAFHAVKAEVRLYDNLFTLRNMDDMDEGKDYKEYLNPDSLEILHDAVIEPAMANPDPYTRVQFLRHGYFCVDPRSKPGKPVFNRIVSLKDTWAKIKKKG